jgi:hypothetical protein
VHSLVELCSLKSLPGRILVVFLQRQSSAAIDKLFLSNVMFGFVCHPFILVYYIAKYLLYPMKDYIGVAGCIVIAHLGSILQNSILSENYFHPQIYGKFPPKTII